MENRRKNSKEVQKINYSDNFTDEEKAVLKRIGVDPDNVTEDDFLKIEDDVPDLLQLEGLRRVPYNKVDIELNELGLICDSIMAKMGEIDR